jgi:hypothetical protein
MKRALKQTTKLKFRTYEFHVTTKKTNYLRMKTNKILVFLTILLLGLLNVGCDDNMPEVKEVGVESITLSEELAPGVAMEVGTTISIARKVTLLPVNATDRAESFFSSNTEVATVNAKGQLTANSAGTSEITISVGGKEAKFTLTVVGKFVIPATKIELAILNLDLKVDVEYDLMPMIIVTPFEANDGLNFSSSNADVVSVSENGLLKGLSEGDATITVSSKHNPAINTTLPVSVTVFSGDYPRTNWIMTASQAMFKSANDAEKNSLLGAFDGDLSTNFCMVRPGKNFGTNPNVAVPLTDALSFVVDMQKAQEVNYFRIRHRDATAAYIRWYRFDEISGSNDGVNFTVIATNVEIPNAGTASQQESADIAIPSSNYRYLKFYAKEAACFYQSSYTSQGSSVQIQELYLGLKH